MLPAHCSSTDSDIDCTKAVLEGIQHLVTAIDSKTAIVSDSVSDSISQRVCVRFDLSYEFGSLTSDLAPGDMDVKTITVTTPVQ